MKLKLIVNNTKHTILLLAYDENESDYTIYINRFYNVYIEKDNQTQAFNIYTIDKDIKKYITSFYYNYTIVKYRNSKYDY